MQIVFNYVWKAITKYANKLITNIAIQVTRKMYFPVSGIILHKKVNKEQTIFLTNKKLILNIHAFNIIRSTRLTARVNGKALIYSIDLRIDEKLQHPECL